MATTCPLQSRIGSTGIESTIPTGWSRDNDLDDAFMQPITGDNPNPSVLGGPHNHTDSGHSHIGSSHTHSLQIVGAGNRTVTVANVISFTAVSSGHTHSAINSVSQDTGGTDTAVITIDNADAIPESRTVMWLKPDDGNQNVPNDSSINIFTDEDTIPSGYVASNAFDNRLMKAEITSLPGGNTLRGAATHLHSTSGSHTHTFTGSHNHPDSLFGVHSGTVSTVSGFPGLLVFPTATQSQHHTATDIGNVTPTINSKSGLSSNSKDNLPPWIKLRTIRPSGGGNSLGICIFFIGNKNEVPNGWQVMDGSGGTININGRQIMGTSTVGEIGDTGDGGITSHSHAISHSHTTVAHTHTYTFTTSTASSTAISARRGSVSAAHNLHGHSSHSMQNAAPATGSNLSSISTVDGRWYYRECYLIKRVPEHTVHIKGGSILGASIAA